MTLVLVWGRLLTDWEVWWMGFGLGGGGLTSVLALALVEAGCVCKI